MSIKYRSNRQKKTLQELVIIHIPTLGENCPPISIKVRLVELCQLSLKTVRGREVGGDIVVLIMLEPGQQ